MASKLGIYYWMFGGVVGVVGGIILLLVEDYVWGIIGIVAGAYLFYSYYQKLKAKKAAK